MLSVPSKGVYCNLVHQACQCESCDDDIFVVRCSGLRLSLLRSCATEVVLSLADHQLSTEHLPLAKGNTGLPCFLTRPCRHNVVA